MPDKDKFDPQEIADFVEKADAERLEFMLNDSNDPILRVMRIYQLCWSWAHFEIVVLEPEIDTISPPLIIHPDTLADGSKEFVYTIFDHGNKLQTSKAEDMFSAGMSMCRLYYTIEKMIFSIVLS